MSKFKEETLVIVSAAVVPFWTRISDKTHLKNLEKEEMINEKMDVL